MPEVSPYGHLNKERLENPKFSFRTSLILVQKTISTNIKTWLDIGCANGEFLDFLSRSLDPSCGITGIEITPEFYEIAESHFRGADNVSVILGNFLELTRDEDFSSADVVSCLGTLPIFAEPEVLLNKLMDAVNPGGILVVDGRFNRHDISVVLNYRDESSHPADLWRCDFNIHSEKMIHQILGNRSDVKSVDFHYPEIDVDIPKIDGSPHRRVWTETGDREKKHIRNGMLQILDPAFLVVKKR